MTHGACRRAVLDDRMTEAADRHLAACNSCAAFAHALSAVDRWKPIEVPPPPAGLADRVVARVRAEAAAEAPSPTRRSWWWSRPRLRPVALGLSVAAPIGLVLVLAGGSALHGERHSGAGGGPAASPRPVDPCASSRHCIVIAVDIVGDTVVSGTERQALQAPCATLAAIAQRFRGDPTAGSIALPIVHSANGHQLFIGAGIEPYSGPGDYVTGVSLGVAPTPTTFPTITIDGRDYTSGKLGSPPRYATLSAIVRADGSGSLSFNGLMSTHDSSRTVSGLVSWTCS